MTISEFNTELDVIYENINKNGAPGLDLYEKSVILTHAQELLVKSVLEKEPAGDRFPELIIVETKSSPTIGGFDGNYIFDAVTNSMKVLNEFVTSSSDKYTVLAISNEQYQVKKSKAYSYPPRRRAWRIGLTKGSGNSSVEIRTRNGIVPITYTVRYLRAPYPIILTNLSSLVPAETIDGEHLVHECELNSSMHRDILQFAVRLAEQYYFDKYGTDGDK